MTKTGTSTGRDPRQVIHYGVGTVTDCGRELSDLPPSHYWTNNKAGVTCGECKDALAHLEAKCSKPAVQ